MSLPVPQAEDLTPQAIKVARRLDGLAKNRSYDIQLIKRNDEWILLVKDDGVTEIIRA